MDKLEAERALRLRMKLAEEKANKAISTLTDEGSVNKTTLLESVRFIEPCHYEEVVEERFLSKFCGYPLCPNELKDIPTKKYQISSKLNQVYELSDRKRYCSADCFKASKFLEAQISTTPIWLRDTPEYAKEEQSRSIRFWSDEQKRLRKAKEEKKTEKTQLKQEHKQQLVNEIEGELGQIESEWKSKFKLTEPTSLQKETEQASETKIVQEKEKTKEEEQDEQERKFEKESKTLKENFFASIEIHKKPSDLNILKLIFKFKNVKEFNEENLNEQEKQDLTIQINQKIFEKLLFIEYIIERLADLLTKRTKLYILDKDNEKLNQQRQKEETLERYEQFVNEKSILFSQLADHFDKEVPKSTIEPSVSNEDNGEAEMQAKLQAFEQTKGDSLETKSASNENEVSSKKPMPDFNRIRQESIKQQLKIKEFFTGKPIDTNVNSCIKEDEDKMLEEFDQKLFIKLDDNQELVRLLPSVDNKSQMQIRRKIFYEKLIKYMEHLLKFSNFIYSSVSDRLKTHVKNFVFSLNLTNENVVFGTDEWPILSLFVLKILSLKSSAEADQRHLNNLISNDKLVRNILNWFYLNENHLNRICTHLIRS